MAQIILDSANNLIQGDFDTATLSLRTRMQTSTTNATTGVYVVPNGSATSASVQIANAANATNASKIVVATNASTDTQIVSGANGSGSYLPLSFYTNNDIRFQMGNAGELNVRTAPGTVSSGTSGQFLTSGGPGAGVSWTTAASGQIQTEIFTAPGTWTKPASCTQVRVTVVGGGAAGQYQGQTGGAGGYAQAIVPVSAPVAITVGAGGNSAVTPNAPSAPGNTSSFGSAVSATGGAGAFPSAGIPGTGTVSTGTAIKSGPNANYLSVAMGGFLFGRLTIPSSGFTPNVAYSTSGANQAGAPGTGSGLANASGGCGGAVVVEFIG